MSIYVTSALAAFIIFAMGVSAILAGAANLYENRKSKSGLQMFMVTLCIFFWDSGYAFMSLCFDDDFAYIARAVALLSVTFYMFFILRYVGNITEYPKKKLNWFLTIFLVCSLAAWVFIIQKNAVTFTTTPWGYWYYSQMSVARLVQFASIIAALIQYYIVLTYGKKQSLLRRQRDILNQFGWFGPILFFGYILDTLLPTFFKMPAIPGSSVSAFFSAMILFRTSQKNKVFGLSVVNVSQYVFNDVHIPVLITDDEERIMLCNDYSEKYLSLDKASLKKKKIDEIFNMTDIDVVRVFGSNRECKLDVTEVKDKFDDLLYKIYFVHDVTKEREAYRAAEESRILAEEANKAKSNFLANMSHEIRTPMNAIIGMSEIIREDSSLSEETISKANDIYTAGTNLLGIVNDILDISKIESGKYELIIDDYDVPSMINDVSNIIDARLIESGVKFIVKIDETIPHGLKGDVLRIRGILLNIIGNAVKFTKQGSITLDVKWDHNEEDPRLFFDVTDTGIGIKEENIGLIFDEFSQVDTRRNRSIQGTGLGLAISKNLAMLMDGDITVESVYGEGSTFHITIKQAIDKYVKIGDEVTKALENHNYRTAKRKDIVIKQRPDAKVLIVDDTKINLTVASHLLKKYGLQIDTATSGEEAIKMVQEKDYNIVFMDHMMPEMDGVEATKRIRALGGKYEELVIVALTANAISEAKEMFLREGLQDFLAKPIEFKALDDVMNKWIP